MGRKVRSAVHTFRNDLDNLFVLYEEKVDYNQDVCSDIWLPLLTEADYQRTILNHPSLSSKLLGELPSENQEYYKDLIRYAMVTVYGGAVETVSYMYGSFVTSAITWQPQTIAATSTFLLLMILHPEVQNRAREEIDAVVGRSRLPSHEDQPNLPYTEAVLKEVLRWNPPVPLST